MKDNMYAPMKIKQSEECKLDLHNLLLSCTPFVLGVDVDIHLIGEELPEGAVWVRVIGHGDFIPALSSIVFGRGVCRIRRVPGRVETKVNVLIVGLFNIDMHSETGSIVDEERGGWSGRRNADGDRPSALVDRGENETVLVPIKLWSSNEGSKSVEPDCAAAVAT